MRSLFVASLLALASFVPAQSCGTLAITGTGAPNTTLDVALTGATANGLAIVFVGQTTGSTTIRLPGSNPPRRPTRFSGTPSSG